LIELTPQQAALIAQNVYNVLPVVQDMKHVDLGIDDLFSVENDSRFQGKSGGIIFNSQTGFGYVAGGIFQHANEALVAIRGTALSVDWITDLNAGIDIGPSGYPVHSGFSKSYKSFRTALDTELNRLKPSAVHVVGHSLGGALATLAADHIKSRGVAVKLYTFGAPRAGTIPHAYFLTGNLGEQDIYRVYHVADPVPMVPIFPFRHAAVTNNGYLLNWPGIISFDSHLMKGYVRSIGRSDWRGLKGLVPVAGWEQQAEAWVHKLDVPGSIFMQSGASLWLILHALEAIVRGVTGTIGLAATCGITLLDRLAQLLYSGVLISVKIAEQVKVLLAAMVKFLGHTLDAATQISVAFISWVFQRLFRVLATTALKAVYAIYSGY